jgi:hypothetical protein
MMEAVLVATDQNTSDAGNDLSGRMVCSFIIKIWPESPEKGKQAKWRGHITHVPSQERRYLKSLKDITDFVNKYLQYMGVRVDLGWRWKQRLKRRKSS